MIKLVKQIDICTSKFQGFNLREGKKRGGGLVYRSKKKKSHHLSLSYEIYSQFPLALMEILAKNWQNLTITCIWLVHS